MPTSTMYQGRTTGSGQAIPLNPNGSPNLNALMANMVSRDKWTYYYTLKLGPSTTYAASYSLFNAIGGTTDPYAITTGQILSHVETNMPAPASNGFPPPRDLIMDQLGFYFRPGGCGLSNSAVGTSASFYDMASFCQYSYFEFKIIDKVFIEGCLELNPSGLGFSGYSTNSGQNNWALGMVNPHATNRLPKDYAKYLAPQLQFSLTIYFPSGSGPAGASAATLGTAQGGNGLWLVSTLTGLTDRAVQ